MWQVLGTHQMSRREAERETVKYVMLDRVLQQNIVNILNSEQPHIDVVIDNHMIYVYNLQLLHRCVGIMVLARCGL